MDPSNSVPPSDLIVTGEKHFHKIFSQILVAKNKEVPEPIPYPAYNISSRRMTTIPAKTNYKRISKAFPVPKYSRSPYYPE